MRSDRVVTGVEDRQRARASARAGLEEVQHELLDPVDREAVAAARPPVLGRLPPHQDLELRAVPHIELEAKVALLALELALLVERRLQSLLRGPPERVDVRVVSLT